MSGYDVEKVTPRPWKAISHIVTSPGVKVPPMFFLCGHPEIGEDAKEDAVSVCAPIEDNAAHIVHCVNHHEELVEMMKDLLQVAEDCGVAPKTEEAARALLAKVEP